VHYVGVEVVQRLGRTQRLLGCPGVGALCLLLSVLQLYDNIQPISSNRIALSVSTELYSLRAVIHLPLLLLKNVVIESWVSETRFNELPDISAWRCT
jgi:hypothetical protein